MVPQVHTLRSSVSVTSFPPSPVVCFHTFYCPPVSFVLTSFAMTLVLLCEVLSFELILSTKVGHGHLPHKLFYALDPGHLALSGPSVRRKRHESAMSSVMGSSPNCMTFRHRHFRLSRLIELAEVEEGKAEAGESKTEACEEEKRGIREQSGPGNRLLLVPPHLFLAKDKRLPTLARVRGKQLRTSTDTRNNQAPSSQRDGCRILSSPTDRSTSEGS